MHVRNIEYQKVNVYLEATMKKFESIDNNKHMPRFEDFEEKVEDVEHESADTFDVTHKNV